MFSIVSRQHSLRSSMRNGNGIFLHFSSSLLSILSDEDFLLFLSRFSHSPLVLLQRPILKKDLFLDRFFLSSFLRWWHFTGLWGTSQPLRHSWFFRKPNKNNHSIPKVFFSKQKPIFLRHFDLMVIIIVLLLSFSLCVFFSSFQDWENQSNELLRKQIRQPLFSEQLQASLV